MARRFILDKQDAALTKTQRRHVRAALDQHKISMGIKIRVKRLNHEEISLFSESDEDYDAGLGIIHPNFDLYIFYSNGRKRDTKLSWTADSALEE